MLKKLLRYEFKSSARIFGVVYLAIFALCLSSGILNKIPQSQRNTYISEPMSNLGTVVMVITGLFLFAAVVITTVVNLRRFYQGVFQDEGYLLHTLPVDPWQIIASKLIPAVAWTVATVLVMGISMMLAINIGWEQSLLELFREIGEFFAELTRQGEWGNFLLTLLTALLSLITTILQVYAAIALGQIFTKHKIAGALLIWFGMNTVQSWISVVTGEGLFGYVYETLFSPFMTVAPTPSYLLMLGISLLWSAVYWAVTQWVLSRKLNLE